MSTTSDSSIYRVEEIEVDPARACLRRDGREIHLKPKSFRVLLHLLEQRHRLVTKDELMDLFWKDTPITDDALTQCITDARRALGDSPRRPTYLKTVPRMGYRFVGPVQVIVPETVAASEPDPRSIPAADLHAKPPALPARRIRWVIAGVLIAGSLGAAVFWTAASWYRPPFAVQGKRLVAILPFENRSGQSELDWLREGLPDMLTTTFSRLRSIDVLSREQVYAHRKRADKHGIAADLEFARAAHAQAAITGSFSQLGNSMRLDVRVYDTGSGSVLAADHITVDRQDRILTQVDYLAARLAGRLGPRAPDPEQLALGSLMTHNLEAYRYYTLGLEKADAIQTPEAIEFFEKALALDPGFVMAQARIGYAYAVTAANLERGKPYLEKAFRMSGQLTDRDRRHIIAWYAIANQDYENAIRLYTKLIDEYPNDPEGCFRLAGLLRGESRHEEALEFLHRANAIDPEDPKIYNLLSAVHSELGKHDDAISMAEHYRALAPADANAYDSLGLACYMAGQYERALEAYKKALALNPDFHIVSLHRSLAYAALGRVRDGVRESLLESKPGPGHMPGCRALDQAIFILWRGGKTEDAKKLAGGAPPECDPRLMYMVLGKPAIRGSHAFAPLIPGRGARFGQRGNYFYLAEFAKLQGRTPDRLANLRLLLGVRPAWAETEIFEDALGDAYLELGHVDDAIAEYERALRLFPGLARARYHLAQAYRLKGENQLAKAQFHQFLQLWKQADPDLPELAEARRWAE